METHTKPRVVILGSGFAGVYTYVYLQKMLGKEEADIFIVSETDHFLFVPLLHEVACGNLEPGSIRQALRSLPQTSLDDIIAGSVYAIDLDQQTVHYKNLSQEGEGDATVSYDYLVVALGSDTAYFNVPGARENTIPLKSLDDSRTIKNRVIEAFERAQAREDEEEIQSLLTFVVVGGGPSGCELAAELSDLLRAEIAASYPLLAPKARVVLLEGSDRLVKQVGPWFSEKTKSILEKKGNVTIELNCRAEEILPLGVKTGSSFISARTVIWTAGICAQELEIRAKKPVEQDERSRRLHVLDTLSLPEYPHVFVAGDQACIMEKDGKTPYPQRAQFAIREANVVAKNIRRSIEGKDLVSFSYTDTGLILSLGKGGALAEFHGIKLKGFPAWIVYRAGYLSKILGARAKMRTFLEWSMNFFMPRDLSQL